MSQTEKCCGKCRWSVEQCDCPNGPTRIWDYKLPEEKIGFVGGHWDGKQPHVGIADLYQVHHGGNHFEYYELVTNCIAVCTPEAKARWESEIEHVAR